MNRHSKGAQIAGQKIGGQFKTHERASAQFVPHESVDGPLPEDGEVKKWVDKRGKLHRTDGPALKWNNGDEEYFVHGKRHRTDGPAVIIGSLNEYHVDGQLHRTDGPAVVDEQNPHRNEYYVDGAPIGKETFEEVQQLGSQFEEGTIEAERVKNLRPIVLKHIALQHNVSKFDQSYDMWDEMITRVKRSTDESNLDRFHVGVESVSRRMFRSAWAATERGEHVDWDEVNKYFDGVHELQKELREVAKKEGHLLRRLPRAKLG